MTGYIGTYASPASPGLYRFTLDPRAKTLTPPQLWLDAPDCKYVAVQDGLVAAPVRRGPRSGLLVADAQGRVLAQALPEQVPACHAAWHGGRVFTANYHEGTVLVYRFDGSLTLERRLAIAPKAGCHQVLLHGPTLLVPCLELDEVRCFDLDHDCAPLPPIPFPPGSGPRHGVLRGEALYMVTERSNRLFTLQAGTWEIRDVQHIAPGPAATSAIRLSPNGRFLYISTREADLITVFRVDTPIPELVQQVPCGGVHPRDLLPTTDGTALLVVNRTSNELLLFSISPETGRIEQLNARAAVHEGVALALGQD